MKASKRLLVDLARLDAKIARMKLKRDALQSRLTKATRTVEPEAELVTAQHGYAGSGSYP